MIASETLGAQQILETVRAGDARVLPHIMEYIDVEKLAIEVFRDKEKAQAWLSAHNLVLGMAPASMLGTDAGRNEVRKVLVAIATGGSA